VNRVNVYTSGCWDLFHIGHLNFLKAAKRLGDVLIVGVNTDKMIYQYKERHPTISFKERKRIVESLKCVDIAVPHTLNETKMLDRYCITIIAVVSGYGKFEHQRKFKEYAEKKGVKFIVLPYTKGISTIEIIEKIAGQYAQKT